MWIASICRCRGFRYHQLYVSLRSKLNGKAARDEMSRLVYRAVHTVWAVLKLSNRSNIKRTKCCKRFTVLLYEHLSHPETLLEKLETSHIAKDFLQSSLLKQAKSRLVLARFS